MLNFHRVLFFLFQGLSMKTYSRVYFSLSLFLAISRRSQTQRKLNQRENSGYTVSFSWSQQSKAPQRDHYLVYQTEQSVDLTVIGNPVFTLSRDCCLPLINATRVIMVYTFYFFVCNICKYNIAYQIGQSFDFTMIGNTSCCRFFIRCMQCKIND